MKSEIRNPTAERNPKSEARIAAADAVVLIRISGFGLLSDFDIRISDLFLP